MDLEGEFKEENVQKLFRSFILGDPSLIDAEFLNFMDTVATDKVLWIMSHENDIG